MAAFTTIAAGIGLAATAAGTAKSFSQAASEKKKQRAAEQAASESMEKARKRLEVNYADALSLPKEGYELQREALLSAGAQALEQGIESERGGAATAGRVLAAQQAGQGQIRAEMGKDLFNLQAMQAEEDSRLRDVNTQLDIGEAQGAQVAAAEAQERAAMFQNQGVQGAVQLAGQAAEIAPLFSKTGGARQGDKMLRNAELSDVSKKAGGLEGLDSKAQIGTAAVGKVGDKNYQKASSDFAPASNMYDGVDITPILNNPTRAGFKDFMAQQDGKWARDFRRNLGIKTRAGQAFDAFGSIF